MSQCLEALALANATYSAQAAELRKLRKLDYATGRPLAAAMLRDPDEIVGSIRVERFLRSVPRVGAARARRLTFRAGIASGRSARRIRELTERERFALAAVLDKLGARDPDTEAAA